MEGVDEWSHALSMENGSILKSPYLGLKKSKVSHVSVHCWSNGNTTVFSLSGSEIKDCILLSMPEGIESRSWLKSYIFKDFLFPDVCINWGTNWGERIL